MKTKRIIQLFIFLTLSFQITALFPVNILTVQDPDQYGSKSGYIDKATLIIEPHGCYTEQSLYLEYSDHGQYPGNDKIEIVHRFELPQGSVINDLWLWIEDSVMQAIMMDTWTARAIYDSIVDVKRDPAFLSKKGNQYELHIYPLESGSSRKIKLNFITPTLWRSNKATAKLPFKMLNSNNAETKPLEILFRTQENIWGQPFVVEQPDLVFESLIDTAGYHYKHSQIPDISEFSYFNMEFQTKFNNGYFYSSNQIKDEPSYFQLGIVPGDFFKLDSDTTGKQCVVGLDLSGLYNKNFSIILPNIISALTSWVREKDNFQLLVAGVGKYKKITDSWIQGSLENINGAISEFEQSDFASEINEQKLLHILYCDKHAATCWKFPGIDDIATWEKSNTIINSLSHFKNADIIAAYNHGNERPLSDQELERVTTSLDTFFYRGGRLLSFYDYNRVGREKLASYYIDGLTTNRKIQSDLYRNLEGNIGKLFPETIYHHVINLLEYDDDPSVKIELMDNEGSPAVISKKIKNGLLVVSGIWSFKDDGALRALLGAPLLGLNAVSTHRQLPELLNEIQNFHATDEFDKVVIFSNSDSLVLREDAINWTTNYLSNYLTSTPVINCVNLLDGSTVIPAYISDNNIDYYGSGFLLKTLADKTYGLHFETHLNDWDFIASLLSPNSAPNSENFTIDVSGETGDNSLIELREVNPIPNDPNKPIFFIGSTTNKLDLHFDISAKFVGQDSNYSRQLDFPISHDSTLKGNILPSMLGFERLKDMFIETSYDTAAIVELAMQYNLLCDYTSLIALEPDEQHHFIKDPLDEGNFTSVEMYDETQKDTLNFDIYPNPFNSQTKITLDISFPSKVKIDIYNIRGQLVQEIYNYYLSKGRKTFTWDGRNSLAQFVGSGLYFVKVKLEDAQTKNVITKLKRVILIR
jgi:hypothetical protein